MLKAFLIVTTIIFLFSFLACIVPMSQYIYWRFVKKDKCLIKYYFSEHLFNTHLNNGIRSDEIKVLNNRQELSKLWDEEMSHTLP